MPGRDGTGPLGIGPFTGRGSGGCIGNRAVGIAERSFAFGWGTGAGRGFRRVYRATGITGRARPGYSPVTEDEGSLYEKAVLKEKEKFLEIQLKQVKERLKEYDGQ